MRYPLRLYEPDRVYEITTRGNQGRFLLKRRFDTYNIIAVVLLFAGAFAARRAGTRVAEPISTP